jgi:hypothetical protein
MSLFCNRNLFLVSRARVYSKNPFLYRRHTYLQGKEANYIRKLSVTLLAKITLGITKTSKFWFGFLSSSLLRGQLGGCVCVVFVCVCVLTTCWMTRQLSDRSSDRVTARWQPPRASSGKPFETGSHRSTDTKTPAGMAVDEASSKSSGWKLNQRYGIANCASKYLANINELRPGAPPCKLSSGNKIQLC